MKTNKIQTVDFLKGISIIMVIICHCQFSGDERLKYGFPFYILLAVGIFMTLSGYVWALSLKRRNQLFSIKTIVNRLCRFYLPFILVFIIEEIVLYAVFKIPLVDPFKTILAQFISGGVAMGGYYVPLMLQMTILFPVIYYCVNRWQWKGVAGCAFVNFSFELFRYLYDLPQSIYRLMIFRYFFAISYGVYLAVKKTDKIKKEKRTELIADIIMFCFGFIFILYNQYFEIGPFVFVKAWVCDSMLSHLFTVIIVKYILKLKNNINILPINAVGKMSYHIFLTQGLYFSLIAKYIYAYNFHIALEVFLNIIISIALGVVLYLIDKLLFSKIANRASMLVDKYKKKEDVSIKKV